MVMRSSNSKHIKYKFASIWAVKNVAYSIWYLIFGDVSDIDNSFFYGHYTNNFAKNHAATFDGLKFVVSYAGNDSRLRSIASMCERSRQSRSLSKRVCQSSDDFIRVICSALDLCVDGSISMKTLLIKTRFGGWVAGSHVFCARFGWAWHIVMGRNRTCSRRQNMGKKFGDSTFAPR